MSASLSPEVQTSPAGTAAPQGAGGPASVSRSTERAEALEHAPMGAGYRLLRLSAPQTAGAARPGQFVHVRVPGLDPAALRRPFSICDARDGVLTILYKEVGRGTAALAAVRPGDAVDVLGPLGRGFPLPPAGARAVLVGGGYGVAPLHFLARAIRAAAPGGPAPVLFVGGRSAPDVLLTDWFERLGVEVRPATNDGSLGEKGLVTAPLDAWLDARAADSSAPPAVLYACGPAPMLRAVDERALARSLPAWISLDRRMACGVGACLGCTQRVRTDGGQTLARVCADGPVFPQGSIVWDDGPAVVPDERKSAFGGEKREERREKKETSTSLSSLFSRGGEAAASSLFSRGGAASTISPFSRESEALAVDLGGLRMKNPVTVASGTFGYGKDYAEFLDLRRLGAVTCKGICLEPAPGNEQPRIAEVRAGMLNAIGLQGPGVRAFARTALPFLRGLGVPAICNVWGHSVEEYAEVARILSDEEGVSAIELNVSCPNVHGGGAAFGTDPRVLASVVAASRAATRLPLFVKLAPNVPDVTVFARAAEEAGADALSISNTIPAMTIDIERRRPFLANVQGGLSGPALHPVAVRLVWQAAAAVRIPILGMGGIVTPEDAIEFLCAGATAVAVGTANFVDPTTALRVIDGIRDYMVRHGLARVADIAIPH